MPPEKKSFKDKIIQFYALILFFMIPILIIANSLWRISVYQQNMALELSQKSKIIGNVISVEVSENISNPTVLQEKLEQLKKTNNQIHDISVLKPTDSNYQTIASTNPENLGVTINDSDFTKVWIENEDITRAYTDKTTPSKTRYWFSATLIKNNQGDNTAILALLLNSSEIDTLNKAAINQSLILLVFTVFVVFLLLINYFRFFEYFINYRKIQEVDRLKDEFISVVSHEIKTPLATMKGYLDMMLQGLTGKFDQVGKDHLEKVFANVKRLDLLVSELLDVSRLEQNRMQFDMQPADLHAIVSSVIDEIGDQAKDKGLVIVHDTPKQLPPVFVDPDRAHQIFENLICNAIKYTLKGKISISYSLVDDHIRISIKDTGFGMNPADMKRLFERFYRIKNEKTADISGTGLGLWISAAIAKRMNGEIEVKSEENVGSEFTLVMPFIKEKGL